MFRNCSGDGCHELGKESRKSRTPAFAGACDGWMAGFEPVTPWTTTRCSNQLSYIHRVGSPESQIASAVKLL